jgi:hypothetical protein
MRNYISTSIVRCTEVLLRIRRLYMQINVETQPTLCERAIRQIRFEVIRKEDLVNEYSALSTQLQVLQLNTQILNT